MLGYTWPQGPGVTKNVLYHVYTKSQKIGIGIYSPMVKTMASHWHGMYQNKTTYTMVSMP